MVFGFTNAQATFQLALTNELNNLRKKHTKWNWTDTHEHAFKQLRDKIANAQLLRHPKQNEGFIVQCDASNETIGAALLKNHDILKELYALVYAIQKWIHYLLLRKFIQYIDNKNLSSLFKISGKHLNIILSRWTLLLIKKWMILYLKFKMHSLSVMISMTYDDLFDKNNFNDSQNNDKLTSSIKSHFNNQDKRILTYANLTVHLKNAIKQNKISLNKIVILTYVDKHIVPQSIRNSIIIYFHCHALAQHQGAQRIAATIIEHLY
ncbi:hypothetical protein RFI_02713 [Reticulomyxa filosa]|uniref:Reverse transcriptase/retrotransposon-derived protein RNase H-like domain-containing protein n=1 Tax=Reticulomyxa filosa TaxID=46433 RepID=X6P9T2_RETFI|nr:hypothetical protein RFI_02713 [Reticulomyxa filosa]|eukprot:ETO34382.1 hypothetical protein RFI_02713 [Reticulomyxa filosa]